MHKTTARKPPKKIDSAIKEIIDQQYARAKQILVDNLDALHTSASALLEYETIEGKHIHEILDHGKIISEIIKSSDVAPEDENGEESNEEPEKSEEKKPDPLTPGTEAIGAPA